MYGSLDEEHHKWSFWEALGVGIVLTLLSCALAWAGVHYGAGHVAAGDGFPKAGQEQHDLFRFDSLYYLDIAENGYSYNGDPASSPNIVFAPLFPLMVRAITEVTGWPAVEVGFTLNHLLLWGAVTLLFACMRYWFGAWQALGSLFALVTSAGSYTLHAYYSESAMLFFLALCLLSVQRRWWLALALSCAFLGGSRTAALPMSAVFSILLLVRAYHERAVKTLALRFIGYAVLCWAGSAGYLIYIAINYGEPVSLLTQIQSTSWGLFHQEVSLTHLLSGGYFYDYWMLALSKGWATFTDIKTLNLIWMTLALSACVYWGWCRSRHILTFIFVPYFAFLYWSGASSDYLISSHRFFMIMLPIFIMFVDLHEKIAQKSKAAAWAVSLCLLALNAAYGVFHAAYFNQGVWYYF